MFLIQAKYKDQNKEKIVWYGRNRERVVCNRFEHPTFEWMDSASFCKKQAALKSNRSLWKSLHNLWIDNESFTLTETKIVAVLSESHIKEICRALDYMEADRYVKTNK